MALLMTPELAHQAKGKDNTEIVRILFKGNTIIIKKDKLIFQRDFSDLFNNNLIEHSFKCNDRIPDILKKLNKFNHYERNQVLFIIYDLEFFAMSITLRIPFNLFELDVKCCTDQEQIAHYKNKSLQLEKVIKLNNLIVAQYDIRFDKNSLFAVWSCSDLINNKTLLHSYFYSRNKYQLFRNGLGAPFNYIYKELKNTSFIFNLNVVPIDEEKSSFQRCFLDKKIVEENLYFAVKVKHNSVSLTAGLALNISLLKQIQSGWSEQQILDAFSKDTLVGTLKHYDMLNSYYSQQFSIHLKFTQQVQRTTSTMASNKQWARTTTQTQSYECFNVYRFSLNTNGHLLMHYLFSVEFYRDRNLGYVTKRVKSPRIQFKDGNGQNQTYQSFESSSYDILKHHLFITVTRNNAQCLSVQGAFFKFNMDMQVRQIK